MTKSLESNLWPQGQSPFYDLVSARQCNIPASSSASSTQRNTGSQELIPFQCHTYIVTRWSCIRNGRWLPYGQCLQTLVKTNKSHIVMGHTFHWSILEGSKQIGEQAGICSGDWFIFLYATVHPTSSLQAKWLALNGAGHYCHSPLQNRK